MALFSLVLLLCLCANGSVLSRARIVAPFGCSLFDFPKLRDAVQSAELNSYSNIEVHLNDETNTAKVIFFSEEKEVFFFFSCFSWFYSLYRQRNLLLR